MIIQGHALVELQKMESESIDSICGCNAGFRPGVVLDPFCGSGTVLKVAEKLGREAIGIDLGYQELAHKRRAWNQIELI